MNIDESKKYEQISLVVFFAAMISCAIAAFSSNRFCVLIAGFLLLIFCILVLLIPFVSFVIALVREYLL